MANYCTASDIEVILGRKSGHFDGDSTPSLTLVNTEIEKVTYEIDFYLSAIGVTTQPTDTNMLARLRNCCTYGVAFRLSIGNPGISATISDTQAAFFEKMYQKIIDEIINKPELYTNVTDESDGLVSSDVIDGTTSLDDIDDRFPGDYV